VFASRQPLVIPKETCLLLSGARTAKLTEKGVQPAIILILSFAIRGLRLTFSLNGESISKEKTKLFIFSVLSERNSKIKNNL
jgi:hypothetical protein